MQFIALLRRDTERFKDTDFAPHLPEEAEQRRRLYVEGFARQVWNRTDVPGSALLLEAADATAARSGLDTLPLVKTKMMLIDALTALAPYPGFGPRARDRAHRRTVADGHRPVT